MAPISSNGLTQTSAVAVANMLLRNTTLTALDLVGNMLGEWAQAVADAGEEHLAHDAVYLATRLRRPGDGAHQPTTDGPRSVADDARLRPAMPVKRQRP